jgi:hypothetical protein
MLDREFGGTDLTPLLAVVKGSDSPLATGPPNLIPPNKDKGAGGAAGGERTKVNHSLVKCRPTEP